MKLSILAILCAIATQAQAKGPDVRKGIRYDELLLYVTLGSPHVPVADVLALNFSQEDYNEVDAFARTEGVDIEKVMMSAAPVRKGKIIYGKQGLQLNPNHTIKIGSEILTYDTQKTGAENWQTFYRAITRLPTKHAANFKLSFFLPSAFAMTTDDCLRDYGTNCSIENNVITHMGDVLQEKIQAAGAGVASMKKSAVAATSAALDWTVNPALEKIKSGYSYLHGLFVKCDVDAYTLNYYSAGDVSVTVPISSEALQPMIGPGMDLNPDCTPKQAADVTKMIPKPSGDERVAVLAEELASRRTGKDESGPAVSGVPTK